MQKNWLCKVYAKHYANFRHLVVPRRIEQESSIPAPLDSAEEESEGELQGAKPSKDKVKGKMNGGY